MARKIGICLATLFAVSLVVVNLTFAESIRKRLENRTRYEPFAQRHQGLSNLKTKFSHGNGRGTLNRRRFESTMKIPRFQDTENIFRGKIDQNRFSSRESDLASRIRDGRFSSGFSRTQSKNRVFKSRGELFREGKFSNRRLPVSQRLKNSRFDLASR